MSYASTTSVPIERTRLQIEELLRDRGASQFISAFDHERGSAIIGWTMGGRMVRLAVPLPRPDQDEFVFRMYRGKPNRWGRQLPKEAQRTRWEQACRTRWRAILLILLAKFEAIEAGISTFEREFLADTVMADGHTVGQWIQPQLESMYATGVMPRLLPGLGETS